MVPRLSVTRRQLSQVGDSLREVLTKRCCVLRIKKGNFERTRRPKVTRNWGVDKRSTMTRN